MRISDWSSDVCSSDLQMGTQTPRRIRLYAVPVGQGQRHQEQHQARPLSPEHDGGAVQQPASLSSAVVERHLGNGALPAQRLGARSEEHTSELQSLMRISYAVFCLKKKTNKTKQQ